MNGFDIFLGRTDVLIIDTETTGFSRESEVVQIGVVDTQGNILLDALCKPQDALSAQKIHGITHQRMHAEGRPFPEAHSAFERLFSNAAVVWAWNMPFDRRLLKQSCERHGLTLPPLPWRCAMREYANVSRSSSPNVSLATAVHQHGVHVSVPAHSAVGDCLRVLEVMRATGP